MVVGVRSGPLASLSPMLDHVEALEAEYSEVESRLADPEVIGDPDRLRAAGRRFKELEEVLAVGRPLAGAHDDLEAARELADLAEGDDRDLLRVEISLLEDEILRLEASSVPCYCLGTQTTVGR